MNKDHILHYLQYDGKVDEKTNQYIDECIKEVETMAQFKACIMPYHLLHDPLKIKELDLLLESTDLSFYFQDIDECYIIACTLGIEIDRKIKYYEHINMTKALIFDATSNHYLEACCDAYEKTLGYQSYTYRFAPGYGDVPLHLNQTFFKVLDCHKKLGLSINQGGLLVPMKSMIGIVGIGKNIKKTCLSCIRKDYCSLRRGGTRCYVID